MIETQEARTKRMLNRYVVRQEIEMTIQEALKEAQELQEENKRLKAEISDEYVTFNKKEWVSLRYALKHEINRFKELQFEINDIPNISDEDKVHEKYLGKQIKELEALCKKLTSRSICDQLNEACGVKSHYPTTED